MNETPDAFIRRIEIPDPAAVEPGAYPSALPAVAALAAGGLVLDPASPSSSARTAAASRR